MKNIKKIAAFVILIIFTFIIIKKTDTSEIMSMLSLLNPVTYSILSVLQLITLSMTTYIWYFFCNKETKRIGFLEMFRINSAAGFIESITPSSKLGGEAAKIYLLKKYTNLSTAKLSSMSFAKIFSTFTPFLFLNFLVFSSSFFIFDIPAQVVYSFIALVFVVISGLILYWLLNRFKITAPENIIIVRKVLHYYNKIMYIIKDSASLVSKKDMSFLCGISTIEWIMYPIKVYIVARMLNIDASILLITLATFSAYCVSILPLTPGGLGTFETAMALVLSLNGVPFQQGIILALSARIVTFWIPLLISIICWLSYILFDNQLFKSKRRLAFNMLLLSKKHL